MGSKAGVRIRDACLSDVPSIVALESQFPSDRLDARAVRRLLGSPSARVLVAQAGGGMLANVVLLTRRGSGVARIYSIVVAAHARGQGLAGRLLERAEFIARSAGCHTMSLEVRPDNAAALGLYARAGYVETGRLPRFYDDGAAGVRLRKRLGRGGAFPGQRGPGYNTGRSYARISIKTG